MINWCRWLWKSSLGPENKVWEAVQPGRILHITPQSWNHIDTISASLGFDTWHVLQTAGHHYERKTTALFGEMTEIPGMGQV